MGQSAHADACEKSFYLSGAVKEIEVKRSAGALATGKILLMHRGKQCIRAALIVIEMIGQGMEEEVYPSARDGMYLITFWLTWEKGQSEHLLIALITTVITNLVIVDGLTARRRETIRLL